MLKNSKFYKTILLICIIIIISSIQAYAIDDEIIYPEEGTELYYDSVELIQEGYFPTEDASTYNTRASDFESFVLNGLINNEERIMVYKYKLTPEQFKVEYRKLINNNPELFYISSGYWYTKLNGYVMSVKPVYNEVEPEQIEEFNAKINDALSLVDDSMTNLEKSIILHDYLIRNTKFNWNIATNNRDGKISDHVYDAYGALVNGDAVCQGYTLAYTVLLDRLEIENEYVLSVPMNHAWNMIKLDEEWYHTDVTWDDPTPNTEGFGQYKYFMLSDETISDSEHKHHSWTTYNGLVCNSGKYESDEWIFRNTPTLIHYVDDKFYYLNKESNYYLYVSDSLNDIGNQISNSEMTINFYKNGIVRVDNDIYCVKRSGGYGLYFYTLTRYSINTNKLMDIAFIPFNNAASKDGYYGTNYDSAGLRYNSNTNSIQVISSTRPDEIQWEYSLDDRDAIIIEQTENGLQIDIAAGDNNRQCFIGFYKEKQLIDIQTINNIGTMVQKLNVKFGNTDWEYAKVFLVDGETKSPISEAKSICNVALE